MQNIYWCYWHNLKQKKQFLRASMLILNTMIGKCYIKNIFHKISQIHEKHL